MTSASLRRLLQRGTIWLVLVGLAVSAPVAAQPGNRELRIAAASNFAGPMRLIADRFEQLTGQSVTLIVGSTGKHYAQVVNGAPFDVLFAADTLRPVLLESEGHAIDGTRFTYAIGKLALWSSRSGFVDSTGTILLTGDFRHLAIANPTLAPYGTAARQTLDALGLWDRYERRLVRGENIGHAFNFVRSGNAELGFVALSQVADPDHPVGGSYWLVPQELYSAIEQQAVQLTESDVARRFLSFVRSDEVLSIIHAHGYDTPDAD